MLNILIMAALPNEYAHLRKITPRWRLVSGKPYKTFSFALPGKEITLIETGMGGDFATHALQNALKLSRPDLLVFAGFAGALHENLSVGDVCVVTRAMEYQSEDRRKISPFNFVYPVELATFLAAKEIVAVTAVTVTVPPDKPGLAAFLGGGLGIVDMETASIAGMARQQGIPFVCLRAISDALDDELGFDLKDITGESGKVAIMKVLRTILSDPSVIAAFYRSWRRSGLAGKNLGRTLAGLLNLPADTLARIAAATRADGDRKG